MSTYKPKDPDKQQACLNCGSYINPEDFDTDSGARMTSENELTCSVCHHHLATIVWCLTTATIIENLNR